jgi:predicted nucleotide-binding protein (sugar kinase/HSP70/actin superfamily)
MKSSFTDVDGGGDIPHPPLLTPLVSLGEPEVAERQLADELARPLGVRRIEVVNAVRTGYRCLQDFDAEMRALSRDILADCAQKNAPCILVLARPYHMDPGIGHGIIQSLQCEGYPVLWNQYLPTDRAWLDWLFGQDLDAGLITHPLDIRDVWRASYSSNTNEILWGAKFAARCPWITCVIRLSSYECGMDQPTFIPVQRIVETSGTLFFKFGDLDATKPRGSVGIRTETVLHYLAKRSASIMELKRERLERCCPLIDHSPPTRGATEETCAPR